MKLSWTVSTLISKGFRVIKTRMTKGVIETSKQAAPFGFDSNPSKNYVAIVSETMSNEEPVIVGYLNPKSLSALNVGDSSQYSTDGDGNIKSTIFARNDGTLELLGTGDFMVRFTKTEEAYNQLKSDHDKLADAMNQHMHTSAAPGSPTSPPTPLPTLIPALPSTGDISGAKIEAIKTK